MGLGLILDLLSGKEMQATFFVPGRVAEHHPDEVRRIVGEGHEVGVHGYTHRSPSELTRAEEESELAKALDVLRGLGADPVGYRSPSWDFSESTLDLLAAAGLTYSSNMMDDIRPYVHEGHDIVELPVHWMLDDAPHFWFDGADAWNKKIATTSEVRQIWQEEFLGIHALGGLTVLTTHPQIIGRPSRLRMLDEFLDLVRAQEGVEVTTARGVASSIRR